MPPVVLLLMASVTLPSKTIYSPGIQLLGWSCLANMSM